MTQSDLAVTGHRELPASFDRELLRRDLAALLGLGYRNFYIGMALGFDTACFSELGAFPEARRIACAPCPDQDRYFTAEEKERYRRMMEESDERYVIGKHYSRASMMMRNRFMVDRAEALYAFVERTSGGSYQTVKYALSKGKTLFYYGFSENGARKNP